MISADNELEPPYVAGMTRVTSYAEAFRILKSPDFETGRFELESYPFRGETIFELNGDAHSRRRRLETPLFNRWALLRYERDVLAPAIERSFEDISLVRGADGVVRWECDLVRFTRWILLPVASAVVGLDDVATSAERLSLLQHQMYALKEALDVKWSTRDHQIVIREGLDAKSDFVREFFAPSVSRRKRLVADLLAGALTAPELPTDLITLLLLHPSPDWDSDLPAREAILYLLGAISTTSHAIVKAVEELEAWFRDHPADRIHATDTDFLSRASAEALRLHTESPFRVRRARRRVQLAGGRTLEAGECVAIDQHAANRDTTTFGRDAGRFNPWRATNRGVRPYGLAFSGGPHFCIGKPVVTPVGDVQTGLATDGSLVRILKSLYEHAVTLDPQRRPTAAETVEDRYAQFFVRFDQMATAR